MERWHHLLLSADVLLLLGDAGHFTDADSILDVFELQAQVLPGDGQHGTPLPGARLWVQLGKTKSKRTRVKQLSHQRAHTVCQTQ